MSARGDMLMPVVDGGPVYFVPPTQERFLFVVPPVPVAGRPLPRRLSPRRAPLRMRLTRLAGRATRWLMRAPLEQRLFVLLIVAAIGALVFGLVVLEHFHPSDFLGTAR